MVGRLAAVSPVPRFEGRLSWLTELAAQADDPTLSLSPLTQSFDRAAIHAGAEILQLNWERNRTTSSEYLGPHATNSIDRLLAPE